MSAQPLPAHVTATRAASGTTTAALEGARAAGPSWRPLVAAAALGYQLLAGASMAAWLVLSQRAGLLEAAAACPIPALVVAWLAWRGDPDNRQFAAKLFAASMFGPLLLGFWAGGEPSASGSAAWPFMLAGAVLHLLAVVGAVVWLGATVTRVPPAAGVAAVDAGMLRARLLSLVAAGLPASMTESPSIPGNGTVLLVDVDLPEQERTHRITVLFDASRARVRVLERIGARGARPASAAEASMRGPGDAAFDPTRPDAQRVSGITWQATMVEPQRLAASQPEFRGARVAALPVPCAALDGEGVLTLLCAVVTRSGWVWQPGWRA